MKKNFTLLVVIVFSLFSCTSSENVENSQRSHISLSIEENKVNDASNLFAGRLMDACSQLNNNENIALSPLSLQMAMSMLANGAEGETYNEIINSLGFEGMNIDDVNAYNGKLQKALPLADGNVELALANSLWSGDNFPVYPEYISSCANNFGADVESVNMQDEAEATDYINKWVAANTKNKITKVLDKLEDPYNAALVLVNAIYFKGTWTKKFDKSKTASSVFYNYDGSQSEVDMMHNGIAKMKYLDGKRFVCLSLPYGNESFSFDILYPSCNNSLYVDLPVANIDDVVEWLKSNTVPAASEFEDETTINIPKFTLSSNLMGNDILTYLGIKKAFDKENASLSKIMYDQCFVSQVVHSCTVSVDESGAEATAATVVEGDRWLSDEEDIPYTIDHPFIYMIRENSTGAILFMGKMLKM